MGKLQPLDAIVSRLEGAAAAAVPDVVDAANTAGEIQARRVLGHSSLRGARFRVVLDRARTTDHSAVLTVRGTPAGFWVWLERGVERHRIPAGRAPRAAMPLGGGRFASGPVEHPGVRKWRGAWSNTVDAIDAELPKILTRAVVKVANRGA